MIEAKGPGLAHLLQSRYFYEYKLPSEWRVQAWPQVRAAGDRKIEWYFAEPEAAERARQVFDEVQGLKGRIQVHVEPAKVW